METELIQEKNNQVRPGHLFYTSWGYDQTNYQYIIILEVSPSGKTCICQRAGHEEIGYSGQSYIQRPVNKPFGEKFRLYIKVTDWRQEKEVYLVGSYPYLHTGEGSKRLGHFYRVKEGEVYYETDTIFGH